MNGKDQGRTKRIRAIQARRRSIIGLADEKGWRGWLFQIGFGSMGLRDMSDEQLEWVLTRLKEIDHRDFRSWKPRYADDAQMRMIRGLWLEAANIGLVRDRSEDALSAFVRRQTRQDIGQLFPKTAAKVIEALKAMIARQELAHDR